MKLKDILKTNTNKIGWLKVFKKLGADNETMKFVNDNVGKESSGGNSEGIKEYYYKYNHNNEVGIGQALYSTILIEVLYSSQDEVIPINKNITRYDVEDILTLMVNQYCVAIKILDSEVIYFTYDLDNPFVRFPKGSIIDKFLYLAKKEGLPEDQIEEYINVLKSIFVEITKEEYESLITYKPE